MTGERVLRGSAAFQWGALGVGGGGLALCALGAMADPARATFSYLTAFAFALSIALGALLWVALAHVMDVRPLGALRHIAEAIAATLPALALLFLPIILGVEILYPWARPGVVFSPEVQEWMARTREYLNVPFFLVRAAVYFVVWIFVAERLLRRAMRPGPDLSRALSAGSLIAVVFTTSFAAVDWLMSLVPVWTSAAWGLYYFAGGLVGALGMVAVICFALNRGGALDRVLHDADRRAVGKLLLTALFFWAYVAYSQYLIVWIADLPYEVVWYVPRTRTSWRWIGGVLIAGHLLLPGFALLSWRLKQRPGALAAVGAWIVLMHYVDLYWIVLPALRPAGFLPHWLDLAALVGVGGITTAFGAWRLHSRPVVVAANPHTDPVPEYTTR